MGQWQANSGQEILGRGRLCAGGMGGGWRVVGGEAQGTSGSRRNLIQHLDIWARCGTIYGMLRATFMASCSSPRGPERPRSPCSLNPCLHACAPWSLSGGAAAAQWEHSRGEVALYVHFLLPPKHLRLHYSEPMRGVQMVQVGVFRRR